MILNKYSTASKQGTTIGSFSSNKKTSSSSSSSNRAASLDRIIWGQEDDGSDVDGDLICGGNMYVVTGYDNEDDDEGEESKYRATDVSPLAAEVPSDIFDDDEGGNHWVEKQLKVGKSIESKDITATKHIYLAYPTESDSTKDLAPLIKNHEDKLTDHETRISKNRTDIDNLDTRVTNNTTNITNLGNRVTTNEGDITNIKNTLENLTNEIPQVDINAPVILFSGSIHSNNNDGSLTYQPWVVRPNLYSQHTGVQNVEINYQEINGEKKPSLIVTVNNKEGWYIKPTSVVSSVTLDQHWNPTVDFGGNRRSQGYWTTGGVFIDGKIYINAWRTKDDNNDSVNNDCVAYNVQEMNLTIFGIAYKTA